MGNFNQKTKTYLAVGCFILFMLLAYSGIPAYENVGLPGVLLCCSLKIGQKIEQI
jgi:hypothetical protein